jgi:hypothetical protein
MHPILPPSSFGTHLSALQGLLVEISPSSHQFFDCLVPLPGPHDRNIHQQGSTIRDTCRDKPIFRILSCGNSQGNPINLCPSQKTSELLTTWKSASLVSSVEVRTTFAARRRMEYARIQGSSSGLSTLQAAVSNDFLFAEVCVYALRSTFDACKRDPSNLRN